jgi:hypothetical protein
MFRIVPAGAFFAGKRLWRGSGPGPDKAKAAILLAIADEADRNVLHRQ